MGYLINISLKVLRGKYAFSLALRLAAVALLSFSVPQMTFCPSADQAEVKPRHVFLTFRSFREKNAVKEEDIRYLRLRTAPVFVRKSRESCRENTNKLLIRFSSYVRAAGRPAPSSLHRTCTPFRCLILYVQNQDGL